MECFDTDQTVPLGTAIQRKAYDLCIPLQMTLEITLKCSLSCQHCYNFDRQARDLPDREESPLTDAEIFTVIEEAAALGTLFFAFTGGEALLHPRLIDFIRHARKERMAVRLKSNGLHYSERKVAALVTAGASDTDISLYGAAPETHDALTTLSGSFERTVKGIRNAKAGGLRPTINFILTNRNFREYPQMRELARELGVNYTAATEITRRHDGDAAPLKWRMSVAEQEELFRSKEGAAFLGQTKSRDTVQCACARSNCGISSYGDVYPCIGAPMKAGSLREQSLTEIWRTAPVLQKIRGLTLQDFSACRTCDDRDYCQRSSGATYTNTGDYTAAETHTCAQTRLLKQLST